MALSFKNTQSAIDIIVNSGNVPNIVGLQGIGKSDLVRDWSKRNGYAYKEITCSLIQEGDLAMPYINSEKSVSYAINKSILELVNSAKTSKYGILFLDEFNRSTSQVQSELMNLVLQREVAGYHLPDNIKIILAENPSSDMEGFDDSDYTVSFSDKAILGRVVTLVMSPNLTDWVNYGKGTVNGKQIIHQSIIDYLMTNPKEFFTSEKETGINNTPRGWKRASDILYSYIGSGMTNLGLLKSILQGTLESFSAGSFIEFYKYCCKNVNYFEMAKSLVENDNYNPNLYKGLSTVEKDKVFKSAIDIVKSNDLVYSAGFIEFIMSMGSLSFSWCEYLADNEKELYNDIAFSSDKFYNYIMANINRSKTMESGGLFGK